MTVSYAVISMRTTHPDLPRPFLLPTLAIPWAAIALGFALVAFMPYITWLRFAAWMAMGLIVYYLYAHSRGDDAGGEAGGQGGYQSIDAGKAASAAAQ